MMRKLTVLLLSGTICLLGAIPLLAKSQYATIEEYQKVTGNKIEEFSEAPSLRIKVAAGELPPVEERLPKEPVVIEPVEEIGQYGGTWTQCMTSSYHIGLVINVFSYEVPVCWNRGMTEIVPNVFKSWETSEDGRAFTFHLRKGMKWSDGYPFTAEDIRFWYEDIALNKELGTPAKWLPREVQKIDDYTVAFRFVEPPGLFLEETAHGRRFWQPAHYLKRFHPAYTPMEELKKKFEKEGYSNWVDLFSTKLGPRSWGLALDPECPTLNPWVLKTTEFPATRFVFERNPYYWKVDPAGNQLPYLDRAVVNIVADAEMVNMKAMTGEVNLQTWFTDIMNYPLYVESQEEGNYRVLLWPTDFGSEFGLFLNQNVEDEVLRKVIRDVQFRRALSLAIDREAINQTCFLGLGVPRQATVVSASPLYKEEYAKAYTQYDLQRANTLLDEIGLTERDKDGFRLRPDGKTLSLIIGYYSRMVLSGVDALGIIKENWKSVGVKVVLRSAEEALTQKRFSDGELSIIVHPGFDAYYPIDPRILWFLPIIYYRSPARNWSAPGWGPQYANWYVTEGKEGEEPPPEIKRLYDIWEEIKVTVDPEKRKRLFQEILKANAENVYPIGAVGEVPHIVIVGNNFRNVPEKHPWTTMGRYLGPAGVEQFFVKQK